MRYKHEGNGTDSYFCSLLLLLYCFSYFVFLLFYFFCLFCIFDLLSLFILHFCFYVFVYFVFLLFSFCLFSVFVCLLFLLLCFGDIECGYLLSLIVDVVPVAPHTTCTTSQSGLHLNMPETVIYVCNTTFSGVMVVRLGCPNFSVKVVCSSFLPQFSICMYFIAEVDRLELARCVLKGSNTPTCPRKAFVNNE